MCGVRDDLTATGNVYGRGSVFTAQTVDPVIGQIDASAIRSRSRSASRGFDHLLRRRCPVARASICAGGFSAVELYLAARKLVNSAARVVVIAAARPAALVLVRGRAMLPVVVATLARAAPLKAKVLEVVAEFETFLD
eukprot:COSAG02_NODE_33194_length_504_cov_0.565432_1_plen_137_part_01